MLVQSSQSKSSKNISLHWELGFGVNVFTGYIINKEVNTILVYFIFISYFSLIVYNKCIYDIYLHILIFVCVCVCVCVCKCGLWGHKFV